MKLAELPVRVVRPMADETEEQERARHYEYTKKWRDRNREKRNANDRAWRQRKGAHT